MGTTGESFLAGPDRLMRSNSRLLLEDPRRYIEALRRIGVPQDQLTRIQRLGTNILQQRVSNACVDTALEGKSYAGSFTGTIGDRLVGWCSPLDLGDLKWVLETKISLDELTSPLRYFQRRLLFWSLAILLVAMAIQGIAPDATDLASGRALGVICSVLGNAWFPWVDDGTKPEVCRPPQRETTQILREGLKHLPALGFEPRVSAPPIYTLSEPPCEPVVTVTLELCGKTSTYTVSWPVVLSVRATWDGRSLI